MDLRLSYELTPDPALPGMWSYGGSGSFTLPPRAVVSVPTPGSVHVTLDGALIFGVNRVLSFRVLPIPDESEAAPAEAVIGGVK